MEVVRRDHLWGGLKGVAILALHMTAPGNQQAVDRPLVETFLTVSEVARHLRVSNMTVYRLVNSGQLPAVRVGRGYRIRENDVRKYLEQRYMDAG